MKIEKVNDHQIRCTLTKEDLADREIKLSELAYGTDKAKDLFRDMMQQASFQFGFEAEDIPLMIEAIPMSPDCIVLIITKVEDPEELDTRFSKFAPSVHEDEDEEEPDTNGNLFSPLVEAADGVLDLFKRLAEGKLPNPTGDAKPSAAPKAAANKADKAGADAGKTIQATPNFTRMYRFNEITDVSRLARVLGGMYRGNNTLYKNSSAGTYQLVIEKGDHTAEEYNKFCNILSEYGVPTPYSRAQEAYLAEHCELILDSKALQTLSGI